jgi:hypothetical protein
VDRGNALSLPTLAKTWQFDINKTIAATGTIAGTNSALLLSLKNSLKGFGSNPATVDHSCSSTVAGSPGDGVDRWATAANIVFASAGVAHSWMVLKFAGIASNFQVLISASTEGNGAYSNVNWTVSMFASRSVGFTGGTTTARPTASDEQEIGRYGSGTKWNANSGISDSTMRLHVMMSTDGASARALFCASGKVWSAFLLETASPTATWSPPWHARLTNTPLGAWPQSAVAANFYAYDGAAYINSTATAMALTGEARGPSSFGPTSTEFGTMSNDATSEWPIWPVGLVAQTTGARGRWGTAIDLWWGSSAVSDGDTYDTSSKTFAQFAGLIVPWDGSSTPALT